MKNKPIWIGIQIPLANETVKICLGLNLEDGTDLSFTTSTDIEYCKTLKENPNPWQTGNIHLGETILVIKEGEDARVFDDNHNIIRNPEPIKSPADCPHCGSNNTRLDFDYPETVSDCDDCGCDFITETGEIIRTPCF